MERRNTQQKELVLNAVTGLRGHVTAQEVYEEVKKTNPNIGQGTVYRNLSILAEEGKIRRVKLPGGADCFDFTLENHYHVRCIKCGKVMDVDIDTVDDLLSKIKDDKGIKFLSYDILFKGICPDCQ